jgi:hypothetical protein
MADTTLDETLPALDKGVPTIAVTVKGVAQKAQTLQQAVKDYLDFVQQKKGEVAQLTDLVQRVLAPLEVQAQEHQNHLDEALKAAESAVESHLETVREGGDDIKRRADAAGGAMKDLAESLEQAGDRANTAQEKAAAEVQDLVEALERGGSDVEEGVSTAASAADKAEQAAGKSEQEIQGEIAELSAALGRFAGLVDERAGDALERLGTAIGEHESKMNEVIEDLVQKSSSLFSKLNDRILVQGQQVAEAVGEVDEARQALVNTVNTALQELPGERDESDQQLGSLRQEMPPLETAVTSVQEAGQTTGIGWPA